ncbi:MAG: hypothetical protein KatS3mg082_1992 [Nitrospiraceae bacterium]|nr:MAG: hypothetical protein KatS3mg082_1992 [Nitrospiraceae bacterium]
MLLDEVPKAFPRLVTADDVGERDANAEAGGEKKKYPRQDSNL